VPFVRISAADGHTDEELTAISDGVFEAIVDTLDKPGDHRFQLIETYDLDRLCAHRDYIGVPEPAQSVFIHITLSHGRTPDQKRRLYDSVSRNIRRSTGLKPRDIVILIAERGAPAFSFGDGAARYVANGAPADYLSA
jgi:phenylpyruvate tautomerase PptA (4-oxalocrotonate tautomerase family)